MNIWVDANGWFIPLPILLSCLVLELLYLRGWRVLIQQQHTRTTRASAVAKRENDPAEGNWYWRGIFFLIALFAFLVAASAPVDNLSARFFWVHMIQHLLLLIVMAPLLVASAPLLPFWWGLPTRGRSILTGVASSSIGQILLRAARWFLHPVVACALLFVGTWIWHWPTLYDYALTHENIHDWGEHLTFIVVSLLFWALIIPSPPLPFRLGYLGRLAGIGVAIAQNFFLAMLIGFAQVPLYIPYIHLIATTHAFSALLDQEIGASIMWTLGDVPFAIALNVLVQKWLASQGSESGSGVVLQTQQHADV